MYQWIALSGIVSAGISVLVSFLLMRKYSKSLGELLQTYIGGVEAEIEKVRPTISKAYGILAAQGVEPRQLKAAEKMIAGDILESNTDVKVALGILETVSPRGAEYLRENPELLPEILARWWPKIQALTGAENLSDLVKLPGQRKGNRSASWAWE